MAQASQAILALSQDKGPMTAAIQQMAGAAGEIYRTLSILSPGFALPRRINQTGRAVQYPNQVSVWHTARIVYSTVVVLLLLSALEPTGCCGWYARGLPCHTRGLHDAHSSPALTSAFSFLGNGPLKIAHTSAGLGPALALRLVASEGAAATASGPQVVAVQRREAARGRSQGLRGGTCLQLRFRPLHRLLAAGA